jgi:hypothetical protein
VPLFDSEGREIPVSTGGIPLIGLRLSDQARGSSSFGFPDSAPMPEGPVTLTVTE